MKQLEDEFTLEALYGKRSAKEIEFLQRLEQSNKKNLDLTKQLTDLNLRWETGAGKPKKRQSMVPKKTVLFTIDEKKKKTNL